MKLLIVEDDKETAAYLKRSLSEAGHTVDTAAGGRSGLLLAAGEPYDVIILAVAHQQFLAAGAAGLAAFGKLAHVLYDVKSALPKAGADARL